MKNYYFFLIFTLSLFTVNAQWAGFNNNGGDKLWSNDANWAFPNGVTELAPSQNISIYTDPIEAVLDEDYNALRVFTNKNKTNDFVISSLNGETLTIDIKDATKGNDTNGTIALDSETTAATNFTLDCNVTFANSVTPDQFKGISVIYTEHVDSEIIFSDSKTVTFGGTASAAFHGLGTVTLNGTIDGASGILLGSGARVNFGSATSDVSGFTGAITLADNSEIAFNSNGQSSIQTTKMQCNGTNSIVTFEAENVFIPNEIRVSKSNQANRGVNFNVNANQSFRAVKLEGDNSFFNLNIAPNVTSILFYANNTQWSSTAQFNISGFKDGVLKFGNNDSSLNGGAYLSNIHIIDGEHAGKSVALDADGYLYLEETLLSVDKNSITDFSVYPNPVSDMINIQTVEKLKSIVLFDMVGNQVLQSNNQQINVSTLPSGVYILKVYAENGKQATQKIVVE